MLSRSNIDDYQRGYPYTSYNMIADGSYEDGIDRPVSLYHKHELESLVTIAYKDRIDEIEKITTLEWTRNLRLYQRVKILPDLVDIIFTYLVPSPMIKLIKEQSISFNKT